jgi:hypothetical protein
MKRFGLLTIQDMGRCVGIAMGFSSRKWILAHFLRQVPRKFQLLLKVFRLRGSNYSLSHPQERNNKQADC